MNWKASITDEIQLFLEEKGAESESVLTHNETEFDRLFLHGQLACSKDLTKKAVRSFNECLSINPDSYRVNHALGNMFLSQGKYAQSEGYISRAVNMRPNAFKILITWHFLLTKLGKKDDSVKRLEDRIKQLLYMFSQNLGFRLEEGFDRWALGYTDNTWLAAINNEIKRSYKDRSYAVLKDVIPDQCFELMSLQFERFRDSNKLSPQPELKRECITDMPMAVLANYQLCNMVGQLIRKDVIPTYSFGIHYLSGGLIKPHVDRPQNELSMSLSMSINPSDGVSILGAGEGDNRVSLDLRPNEALFYKGCEVVHFREPVPENHTVNQMIFGFRTVNKTNCHC